VLIANSKFAQSNEMLFEGKNMFKSFLILTAILIIFILAFPNTAVKIVYAINGIFRNITFSLFGNSDKSIPQNCNISKPDVACNTNINSLGIETWIGFFLIGIGTIFSIFFVRSFIFSLLPVFGWFVPLCLFGLTLIFRSIYK
jgi:hypothetical protein